jgi:hypothetical protein
VAKKKKKEYLFFDRKAIDFMNGMIMPLKKFVKSKKFKRGY